MKYGEYKFNIEHAIEDYGVCRRQDVKCGYCAMQRLLYGNNRQRLISGEFCKLQDVYEKSKEIYEKRKIKKLKEILK